MGEALPPALCSQVHTICSVSPGDIAGTSACIAAPEVFFTFFPRQERKTWKGLVWSPRVSTYTHAPRPGEGGGSVIWLAQRETPVGKSSGPAPVELTEGK